MLLPRDPDAACYMLDAARDLLLALSMGDIATATVALVSALGFARLTF